MTQAKVRTCFTCKAQFTKEDGCNKMTCRCGTTMCYICRQSQITYEHFCKHPLVPGNPCSVCTACSLWTNPGEDDERAVEEIRKEAQAKRIAMGFLEEKIIGSSPTCKKAIPGTAKNVAPQQRLHIAARIPAAGNVNRLAHNEINHQERNRPGNNVVERRNQFTNLQERRPNVRELNKYPRIMRPDQQMRANHNHQHLRQDNYHQVIRPNNHNEFFNPNTFFEEQRPNNHHEFRMFNYPEIRPGNHQAFERVNDYYQEIHNYPPQEMRPNEVRTFGPNIINQPFLRLANYAMFGHQGPRFQNQPF